MKRRLYRATLIAYLAAMAAVAGLWLRSYRTLDQLYGSVLGRGFDANSFNGQCQLRLMTDYHARAGVYPNRSVLNSPQFFRSLERDPPRDPTNFVARQRWPLRETGYWEADARWFPRPHFRDWLVDGGLGPARYMSVEMVLVPYWLLLAVGALPLPVFGVTFVARRRRRRAGLCAQCGYDLRASPGRCPECGAKAPSAQPTPVAGR